MYDEHQPPKPGVEEAIMGELGESEEHLPDKFIMTLIGQGFPDSDIRKGIWSLIDRGYLELTFDPKFKGHPQPISPAPVDLL
jgi:hypothetical protein